MSVVDKNCIVCFISSIPENVEDYLIEQLKKYENVKLKFQKNSSEEELLKMVPTADILIGWRPSKTILKNAKKAKLFINPGAGIHHLLPLFKEINKERKLLLINGHGNSYFVAQHTV
ncbi:MAG: hypothetical protein ACFFC1_17505, partial [Promethearchaeota archaeon]